MTVLFSDQSKNVGRITPYEVEFRLITPARHPTIAFASRCEYRSIGPATGTPSA